MQARFHHAKSNKENFYNFKWFEGDHLPDLVSDLVKDSADYNEL